MSLRPGNALLRFRNLQLIVSRSVFVRSAEKKRQFKPKKPSTQRPHKTPSLRYKYENSFSPELGEIKSLAANVASYVNVQKGKSTSARVLQDAGDGGKLSDSHIHRSKIPFSNDAAKFDPNHLSLLTPMADIPLSIQDRLGPAVKYLVTKENQNWGLVLKQLEISGGFKNISDKDIRKFVYNLPKSQLLKVFPRIEKLIKDAEIPRSPKIVNAFLKSVISGGSLSRERIDLMERYITELKQCNKKGRLSRETYEILIEAYGKTRQVDKMEAALNEMKAFGLVPSKNVYGSVMNTCVYKTDDHKQAVQLFDSMKFLAGNMAPELNQYQDIIVSYVNNNNIEKALDLYEELSIKNTPVNQRILVALARGCMSRKQLKFKSWEFIFKIYELNLVPTVPTLEYMIYLAAKDGDLALSRALYQRLASSSSASPRSFSFLMLGYAKSGHLIGDRPPFVPSILAHEKGRVFRRNILESMEVDFQSADPMFSVPFLPKRHLSSAAEALSESSAVLAHTLLTNSGLISMQSINMFLDTAAKLGSMEEFIDRYEQFTYFEATGVPNTRLVDFCESEITNEVKIESDTESEMEQTVKHQQPGIYTKSPVFESNNLNQGLKFPRNTRTYMVALWAAARNKNYAFSQAVWQERGKHRKSASFRSLTSQERAESDFKFAASMVNCLTELGLLDDALAILTSTEYQFKWTWKELKRLHSASVKLGHDRATSTVRGIARRAQENFEGKIRKKDFVSYSHGKRS